MSDPDNPAPQDLLGSAYEQSPAMLVGVLGPELRLATWNAAARQALEPVVSPGMSLDEVPELAGILLRDRIREVMRTGRPYVGREWRFALPNLAGGPGDDYAYVDYVYSPWRDHDGRIVGALAVGWDVTAAVRARLAAQAAAAEWEHRLADARAAMGALQSALLPAEVPVLPGLQIAARYLLAEADTAAGGDWFDVLPLPGGRVALVVGDVVGHGVPASAVMGQLRSVLSSQLRSGASLPDALGVLDDYASQVPGAAAATVAAAVLDGATGRVEYCTAGHPPPLVVAADGWRYLDRTGAGPLGGGTGFATAAVELTAGDLLLLYTDGLVERPGRTYAESTVELGQVVADSFAGRPLLPDASPHVADRVCEQVLELLTRVAGYTDDITVLAVHRIAAPITLHVGAPAEPGSVGFVADELDRWLDAVDAGSSDRMALRHAVVELVANVVEHAYLDRPGGTVVARAGLHPDGHVGLTVVDTGHWREPQSPEVADGWLRGLGLTMTRQLVDDFAVEHTAEGTTARVRRRLRRPAPLRSYSGPGGPAAHPEPDLDLMIDVDPGRPDRLTVCGPLHLGTVDRLRTRLELEARGGTRGLVLDLTGLTHLASAGVQLIQHARAAAAGHRTQLAIVAAPGSVAQQVLEIVAVEHEYGC